MISATMIPSSASARTNPRYDSASEAMARIVTRMSLAVCAASAISSALPSARPRRRSNSTTNPFTASDVTSSSTSTLDDDGGSWIPVSSSTLRRSSSKHEIERKPTMPSVPSVSNFSCPYGCPSSGSRAATETATIATTLLSVSSTDSSAAPSTVSAPVRAPTPILIAADNAFSSSTMRSARRTPAERVARMSARAPSVRTISD